MIDARIYHTPKKGPELIEKALETLKAHKAPQAELAHLVGVTPKHIQHIKSGRVEKISYTLQVALEIIAKGD